MSDKVSVTKRIETGTGDNQKSKEVTVKEVENGFTIKIYKTWCDDKGEYQSESKTYISKTDPFKKKEGEKDEKESLLDELGDYMSSSYSM